MSEFTQRPTTPSWLDSSVGKSAALVSQINKQTLYFSRVHNYSQTVVSLMALRNIQVELEFGNVGFYGGRKTGVAGENPRSKDENQQQTQPT